MDHLSIYTGVEGSIRLNNLLRVPPCGPQVVDLAYLLQFRLNIGT